MVVEEQGPADGPHKVRNIILGIAGALALAIAGSALWDFLFKPLFLSLGETIVGVTNLGSTALSTSMYSDIAKGSYERASVFVLAGLGGASTALVVRIFVTPIKMSERSTKFRWSVRLVIIVAIGVLLLQTNRTFFVVRAANYLDQMQKIVGPFIPEDKRLQLASTVALIRTKDDYRRALDQFDAIIISQNLTPPERP